MSLMANTVRKMDPRADVARLRNMTKTQLVNEVRRLLSLTDELAGRAVRAESAKAGYPGHVAELEGHLDDAIDERDAARADAVTARTERDAAIADGKSLNAELKDELLRVRMECDKWQRAFESARSGTLVSR